MKKRVWISILAVVLLLCCGIGGTLAWLSVKTASVQNTFTVGDIDITLAETTGTSYKMVPGNTLTKDPKVTVKSGSEACWLFVKVEKSENFDTFMTFAIADGWTELSGFTGVMKERNFYEKKIICCIDGSFLHCSGHSFRIRSCRRTEGCHTWR